MEQVTGQVIFYMRRPEGLWTTSRVPGTGVLGARGAAVEGVRGVRASAFILPGGPFQGMHRGPGLTSCLEGVPLAAGLTVDCRRRKVGAREGDGAGGAGVGGPEHVQRELVVFFC